MKKYTALLIILFFCLFPRESQAQFFVEYAFGYGTFDMADLKNLLSASDSPVGSRITENFPGYLTQDIRVGISDSDASFGVLFGYMNTGGKKSLADYSGFYRDEIRVKGYKLGVFSRYMFSPATNRFRIGADLAGGVILNKVKTNSHLYLSQGVTNLQEKLELSGVNVFLQPSLIATYPFFDFILLQGRLGYDWSPFKGALHYEGDETNVKTNWNGLRVSLGITFYFSSQK